MATEEAFKKVFVAELWRKYGQDKYFPERISVLWSGMKNFPDSILAQCAVEVIAKNMYAPGVDKILAIAKDINSQYQRENVRNLVPDRSCFCSGSGVRCVDNYAFQCPCPAGKLNHPNAPLYTGQVAFTEKVSENATEIVRETRNAIYRTDKLTGKCSFQMKENPWRDHSPGRNQFNNDSKSQRQG